MKLLILILFFFGSQAHNAQLFKQGNREYRKIKDQWSINDYGYFLAKHPKSKHTDDVSQRLKCKYRFYAYVDLEKDSTQYISFLTTYADCNYCSTYEHNPGRTLALNNADLSNAFLALEEIRADAYLIRINRNSSVTDVSQYEYFLVRFPYSKYISQVKDSIFSRNDRNAWIEANRLENLQSFSKYIEQFPQGTYIGLATNKRDVFATVEKSLISNKHSEVMANLSTFKSSYPTHRLVDSLKQHLKLLEQKPFINCLNAKSVKKWIEFEKDYMGGYYFKESQLKVRQLLKLKKDDQRSPYGSEVFFLNNDKALFGTASTVTIVIEYDGISENIILKPGEIKAIILPNGPMNYRLINDSNNSILLNGYRKVLQVTHLNDTVITSY